MQVLQRAGTYKAEIKANPPRRKIICLVGDDESKIGKRMNGVRIAGTMKRCRSIQSTRFSAMPSASGEEKKRDICADGCVDVMIVPEYTQTFAGMLCIAKLKHGSIARDPIESTSMRNYGNSTVVACRCSESDCQSQILSS